MPVDLITLSEYKAAAGILGTTQDAAINALIPKVSALAKSVCRRTFKDYLMTPLVQVSNGGFDRILLTEYPVTNISSFTASADHGATTVSLVPGVDYVLDRETWELVTLNSNGVFPKYWNGYTITYTAGYATLPEDLKLALIDLVTYYLKNDGAVHSARNVGANSVQIEYITTVNLPAHIKRVLDFYVANYL